MLILLPPSEGKTSPRRGKPLDLASLSFPELEPHRAEVLDALVALCTTDEPAAAARVLGLGSTQTADVAANARLSAAPTARADAVYSGVLYEALGLGSLTGPARRRATSWLAVTSGLFGLLRPADRVPAYRLSGDVSLPGTGTVSTYWSRRLDESVRDGGGSRPGGRPALVDVRVVLAPGPRPGPQGRDAARAARGGGHPQGRLALQQGHQGPARARAAGGRHGARHRRPGSPTTCGTLGWTVEEGPAGRHGTQLDVVVSDL